MADDENDPVRPPSDVRAEKTVLAAMLLSRDAIADVVELLAGADFYRPAHELIYQAVLKLCARGETPDAPTVAAELAKTGQLDKTGGHSYLSSLASKRARGRSWLKDTHRAQGTRRWSKNTDQRAWSSVRNSTLITSYATCRSLPMPLKCCQASPAARRDEHRYAPSPVQPIGVPLPRYGT